MAKLIMWNLMTLDGFLEGPNHDLSWHLDVWGEELERLSIEQGHNAGALLFGRVTYDLMARHWPAEKGEVADFMNALPKFVFSRSISEVGWNNTRVFNSDLEDTVVKLKRDIEKDIYLFGSADLAASLMPHGLIDEYRIGVCPVILGSGTSLFKGSAESLKLKLLDAKPYSTGIVVLRYEPVR